MADLKKIRVAVKGYGVIGKRVAAAVAIQEDMSLAGVSVMIVILSSAVWQVHRVYTRCAHGNTKTP